MIEIKRVTCFALAFTLSATPALKALAAMTQQSILNADQASAPSLKAAPKKTPPTLSNPENLAQFRAAMKNPAFRAAIEKFLKHPNLTYTAKSVSTPAAVPMNWGGIGLSFGAENRYPTATKNGWPLGATLALPFGNSDKFVGGAVAVSWAETNNSNATSSVQGSTGTVSLSFSRWLAMNTIASVGVANLIPLGAPMNQAPKSYNAVVTQMFGAIIAGRYHPMSASVGLGTGSFGPIGQPGSQTDNDINPFVNAAFNFTRNFAIAGDYYSQTFALGLSYNTVLKSPKPLPLSFMIFASNLNHTANAPSTMLGLRISTGLELPAFMRGKM